MIGHDAVNHSSCFLVDARVVAVIGPGYLRLDGRAAEDSRSAACQ